MKNKEKKYCSLPFAHIIIIIIFKSKGQTGEEIGT